MYVLRWLLLLCVSVVGVWLAACRPAPTAVPAASLPSAMPKILATVYLSPTPDAPQLTATRRAARPTETPVPSAQPPTPTVYVGVFLGETANRDDVGALAALDAAQSANQVVAQPTLNPLASCLMQPDARFGSNWMNAGEAFTTLGCPAATAIPYTGVSQVFERGAMYFTPDGAIWAVGTRAIGAGQWWYFPAAPPGEVRDVVPPAGLKVPSLGFGAVWSSVDGVREALGFARTDEQQMTFVVQDFQGGTLLLDQSAGQVFILIGTAGGGTTYGPY